MGKERFGVISNFWHRLSRTKSSNKALQAEDPYEFQALQGPTTIRLIKICSRKVKGCIACKIYHFDDEAQKHIQYQALSYVWGDPQPTRLIFLKGSKDRWHPFPLHENLWQFLNHAWQQKMFGQFFWTDRLCLNQGNHEEISKQVPRMRAIYQNSELVLIWLNLKEEEERYLVEILRLYRIQHRAPDIWYDSEQRRASFDQDVFFGLIGNPYWTRIWIVQEVVVSRSVCVTFRDSLIPLEDLALLFGRIWDGRLHHRPWIWALCDMRGAGKRPLSRILIEFSGYQTSRPADRVYGMLGMVKDNDDGSSPTDNIQVDYDRPLKYVFLDAMFESSPEAEEFIRLPECLGNWKEYESDLLLDGYIADSKTSQRHKDLAKLALRALEILSVIKEVRGGPGNFRFPFTWERPWRSTISPFKRRPFEPRPFTPTLEQQASIIGLTLVRSSHGPHNHWRARLRSRGDGSSPWRCAAHGSVDTTPAGISSYGPIVGTTEEDVSWHATGAATACGEQLLPQSCDGGIMTCEIPQVGLRLLLSTEHHKSALILQEKRSGY